MLVLETPYWSLVQLVRQKCPIIPSVLFRYELPTHKYVMSANCPIHLIHGTMDEKVPSDSSDRLLELCKSNSIDVKGHSIMCGMHNLPVDVLNAEKSAHCGAPVTPDRCEAVLLVDYSLRLHRSMNNPNSAYADIATAVRS